MLFDWGQYRRQLSLVHCKHSSRVFKSDRSAANGAIKCHWDDETGNVFDCSGQKINTYHPNMWVIHCNSWRVLLKTGHRINGACARVRGSWIINVKWVHIDTINKLWSWYMWSTVLFWLNQGCVFVAEKLVVNIVSLKVTDKYSQWFPNKKS